MPTSLPPYKVCMPRSLKHAPGQEQLRFIKSELSRTEAAASAAFDLCGAVELVQGATV